MRRVGNPNRLKTPRDFMSNSRKAVEVPVLPLVLRQHADLTTELSGLDVINVTVGPGQDLCVLASQGNRQMRSLNGMFFKEVTQSPGDIVVVHAGPKHCQRIKLGSEPRNFMSVQPLPHDHYLLVVPRADLSTSNARIIDQRGRVVREFRVGDAVQDVQCATNGLIWVSFFDEGYGSNPAGLLSFDSSGKHVYEFKKPAGTDDIMDCYAMNVETDHDVWVCYYPDFPVVHIKNLRTKSWWESPVKGSGQFAVWKNWVLFFGGYDYPNLFSLVRLRENEKAELLAQFTPVDEFGSAFFTEFAAFARGPYIYNMNELGNIYRTSVMETLKLAKNAGVKHA